MSANKGHKDVHIYTWSIMWLDIKNALCIIQTFINIMLVSHKGGRSIVMEDNF